MFNSDLGDKLIGYTAIFAAGFLLAMNLFA
jgi:hypothetical protein